EEYGDVEWRVTQARAGKLEFLGGKPELLRLGHFDDVDLAMMIHGTSRTEDGKAGVPGSNNGCIVKTVRYVGRAAHAGGAPHMGDRSQVMPILHPYSGGARGTGHGADYETVDKPLMYVTPAKALASMAIDLMYDGAAGAKQVMKAATPPMTREQYLTFQRS